MTQLITNQDEEVVVSLEKHPLLFPICMAIIDEYQYPFPHLETEW